MENKTENKTDINTLAGGAISEALNVGLNEVYENILDPNTDAEKSRKLTIVLDLKPDETRQLIKTKINVKTTLVPANSITTQMLLGREGDKIVASELLKQDPNQVTFDELKKAKNTDSEETNKVVNMSKEA